MLGGTEIARYSGSVELIVLIPFDFNLVADNAHEKASKPDPAFPFIPLPIADDQAVDNLVPEREKKWAGPEEARGSLDDFKAVIRSPGFKKCSDSTLSVDHHGESDRHGHTEYSVPFDELTHDLPAP